MNSSELLVFVEFESIHGGQCVVNAKAITHIYASTASINLNQSASYQTVNCAVIEFENKRIMQVKEPVSEVHQSILDAIEVFQATEVERWQSRFL